MNPGKVNPSRQGRCENRILSIDKVVRRRLDREIGLNPNGVERLHLETEASRLAYAARDQYVADPRHAQVPVGKMLSAEFAADSGEATTARWAIMLRVTGGGVAET